MAAPKRKRRGRQPRQVLKARVTRSHKRPAPRKPAFGARDLKDLKDLKELKELYDFAPVIWMILDVNGVIRDLGARSAKILGSNVRFIIGTPLRMWVDQDDRRAVLDHLTACRT